VASPIVGEKGREGWNITVSAFLRLSALPTGATGGVAMMLLGVLLFAVNDTLGKWLVGAYAVGQLMLVRSIAGLCAMAPFIRRAGPYAFLQAPRPGLQLLRVVFSTLEGSLFFWALTELPLAEVMIYYMAGPIYVTALSPFLLGERVGWRRWTAVAVGFGGVVLALHPSPGSLSFGAVCALAGSFSYALFLIATRKLAGTPGTVLMTGQLLAALLFGGALVLTQGWTPPRGAGSRADALPRHRLSLRQSLREPVATDGAGLRGRALPVHADPLGHALRLSRLWRGDRTTDHGWGRHHHRRRSFHLPA
jgi:S-adenosylmethionine uptake transporter